MIYYIQARDGGPIKIGYTNGDPEDRMAILQTGSPVKLVLLASHEGSRADESKIHVLFDIYRTHGEWFWYVDKIADYIIERATKLYWTGQINSSEIEMDGIQHTNNLI